MGNHSVGNAMSAGADVALILKENFTKEEALLVLDRLGEPWRGADAEFDDHAYPDQPLGRLIFAAFGVHTQEQYAADDELWYEEVYRKFRDRYDFC